MQGKKIAPRLALANQKKGRKVMSIAQAREGETCKIVHLEGDHRFISRITSVGLTPGAKVEVVRNKGKYPLLVFARDSMLAINRKEAKNIVVEVM